MKFSDIPGHEAVKERLRTMVDAGRIPHALLLEGPAGVGKTMLARAMAQYIHCEHPAGGDSCGRCPACRQHATFNHIDTIFSFPVVKGGRESSVSDDYIGPWRQLLGESPYMDFMRWLALLDAGNTQPLIYAAEADALIHKLSFTAHRARYKVVLMWLPERLQPAAANKLLKLIEEPHGDTLFLLVSNDAKAILPTIYSRTQRIAVRRLPDEVVARHLVEARGVAPDDALALAHIAEGSMIAAEQALSQSEEDKQFLDLFIRLMRRAYQNQMGDLKEWATEVAALGRETEIRFLRYCLRLVRESFIRNLGVASLNYLNAAEEAFARNFARFVNERNVERIARELDSAITDIAGNANAKIVAFDLAVRMCIYLKA